jgi:tetratricopeptide (TPR) repeat protein
VFITCYLGVLALFFYSSRFRQPLLPLFILLAVYGATVWLELVRRRPPVALTVLLGIAGLAAFSYIGWYRLPVGFPVTEPLSRGLYFYNQRDYRTALLHYRDAWKIDPAFPDVNLDIGSCFFRLGQADSASYYFRREIELHPGRPDGYADLASLYLTRSDINQARRLAADALEREPYHLIANRIMLRVSGADTLVSLAELQGTITSAATATRNDLNILVEGAGFLVQRGDPTTADSVARVATEASPPAIERDDWAFTGQFEERRRQFTVLRGRAFYLRGYISSLEGAPGQAAEFSRRAVYLDPELTAAYLNLANALAVLGRFDEADSVLESAARRLPDDSQIRQLRQAIESAK